MAPLRIVLWLTTVAWAAEIYYLSTPTFGGTITRSLLAQLINTLSLDVPPLSLDWLDSVLRKLAHLIEYGIFGLLLYGCFNGKTFFHWQPYPAFWSVVIAALYSLTDELHQVFSPGRHARLLDCCVDTAGAAIAMLAVYAGSQFPRATIVRPSCSNRRS